MWTPNEEDKKGLVSPISGTANKSFRPVAAPAALQSMAAADEARNSFKGLNTEPITGVESGHAPYPTPAAPALSFGAAPAASLPASIGQGIPNIAKPHMSVGQHLMSAFQHVFPHHQAQTQPGKWDNFMPRPRHRSEDDEPFVGTHSGDSVDMPSMQPHLQLLPNPLEDQEEELVGRT